MPTNRASVLVLRRVLLKKSFCFLPNYPHHHHHRLLPSYQNLNRPKFYYNTTRICIWITSDPPNPIDTEDISPLHLFQSPNHDNTKKIISFGSQDRSFSDYGARTLDSSHTSTKFSSNLVAAPPKTVGLNQNRFFGELVHQQLDDANASIEQKQQLQALKVLSKLKHQQQGNITSASFDLPTYHSLLQAYGQLKILEYGRIIHDQLVRSMHIIQVTTYNHILDMYCQCGSMSDAYGVFQNMPRRDIKSWDTMISGLAKNGFAEDAILLFTRFKEEGLQPDGQVFLGVFLACGVLGDVVEGMLHFESMNKVYGVIPSMEHYASVVNMLGSAGYLDEGMEFIEKMPFEPDIAIWETLMIFCRAHGNIELGNHCAEIVDHLDPSRLKDKSKERLVPLEAFGKVTRNAKVRLHLVSCTDGDALLPVNYKVYAFLRGMHVHMKELGYVAMKCHYFLDASEEEKEEVLLGHSEKIALAIGLMNSHCRTVVRINKKTCLFAGYVCEDCQNAFKIVAQLAGRQIVVVTNDMVRTYDSVAAD